MIKRHLDKSWHMVSVSTRKDIPVQWLNENIGKYKCYGHYWYFKDPADATLFRLTWS